ncbi:MAG: hypothetical protein AB1427_00595 [Thermodesulfobacteriota bacterium]
MNLHKFLRALKGKRLNEAHYELLRQALALQEEKLALIQAANKVLQETNDLLKDKVRRLEDEIRKMRPYTEKPPVVAVTLPAAAPAKHVQEISDLTVAILQECIERDLVEFQCVEMAESLSCNKSEIETALAELAESGLIVQDSTRPAEAVYRLTAAGKSYARTLPPVNRA